MITQRKKAPSRSRGEWVELVAGWNSSGMTAVQFAAKHGVGSKALSNWRWRLKNSAKSLPRKVAMPKLVELSVADLIGPGETSVGRWELTTIQGHTLRALAAIPNAELTLLLAALVRGTGPK
jgi:hypothetical protein